jgi:hypothetical protein
MYSTQTETQTEAQTETQTGDQMAYTADTRRFRFPNELHEGVRGRRVLITGSGKDGGIGQAFALAAALNEAASVCVHFHRSYEDGFDMVDALRSEGVEAFPCQADVTNMGDLWATRSYIIEQMGGLPPTCWSVTRGLPRRVTHSGGPSEKLRVSRQRYGERESGNISSITSRRAG